jgi:drug/metabolite transporter (DMT)-like permease
LKFKSAAPKDAQPLSTRENDSEPHRAIRAGRTSDTALRGALCMLVAALAFAVVNAIIKHLLESLPVVQVMVWRTSGAFLICWLAVALIQRRAFPPARRLGWHLTRGVLGVAALGLLFISFRFVPLGEATALYFASPVFVALLSPLILGERVAAASWIAIGAGFLGMLLIIRPSPAGFNVAALLPAGASVLLALSLLSSRLLSRTESTLAISFYFSAFSALAVIPAAPFSWAPMAGNELWLLIAASVLGGFAIVLMTEAYRLARAALVAPLDYAGVALSVAIGVLWFGEEPGLVTAIGIGLIALGGTLILRSSATHRKQAAIAPPDASGPVPGPYRSDDP